MASPTDVKITEEISQAVKELREEVVKVSENQDPAKIEAINTRLDTYEQTQQEVVKKQAEERADELELKERIDTLELEIAKKSEEPGRKGEFRDTPEYKSFQKFMINGERGLDDEEFKTLRTDIDPSGGFLVPEDMADFVTDKIIEVSDIQAISRNMTITGKSMDFPIRSTIPVADWEGEAEEGTDSQSTYESKTLTPHRLTTTVPATKDQLRDTNFDMENLILSDAAMSFAFKQGEDFVNGTLPTSPQGFVANPVLQLAARKTEEVGTLKGEDILLVQGELPVGYTGTFVFHRKVLAVIRSETSVSGGFLWEPGLNGMVTNTLAGSPYILAQAMEPDVTVKGSFPVAFGDFLKGYLILRRSAMEVIRDEFSQKRKAIVEFTFMQWITGQVLLEEAIVLLEIRTNA